MPDPTPREYEKDELDRLLTEMSALIPKLVRQACHKLGHQPDEATFDGFVSRVIEALTDHDCHTLRSFQWQAEPSTWLFPIAWRIILHEVERKKRQKSLDDLPPNSLTIAASQEQAVLEKEEWALLAQLASQLNPKEQELLGLMACELRTEEIARAQNKSEGAVNTARSRLKAKLRKLKEKLTSPRKEK